MKKIILIFNLVCFCTAIGQVQKLSELSSGLFLDSAVIMEEDESDVYGYCLLYESDRKSKDIYDLEYVILDKNLNKLTNVKLTQAVYKTWLVKTQAELTFVKKIGNQLTIAVNDRLKKLTGQEFLPYFNYRFINMNLETFECSKEFKYENFIKKEFEYNVGDKIVIDDFWGLQKLTKIKSRYHLAFAIPEYNPKTPMISNMQSFDYKRQQSVKKFVILDTDMNIVWSKDINTDQENACKYSYLDSDKDVLLLQKEIFENGGLRIKSIDVYNINNGDLLGEINIDDEKFDINFFSCSITNKSIHVFTHTYEKDKKGRNLGYGYIKFDKKTLSEASRNFMLWENLTAQIEGVNEFGQLENGNYLFAQDFVITPKENVLMAVEAYNTKGALSFSNNPKSFVLLKDMYLIEFTPENKVSFSKKIEKENSVQIPSGLHPKQMRKSGVFDYIFCQKINDAGDFVIYYTLNDQEGNKRKLANKPLWTLGIVSNVNGEYGFDKLPLYGENVKIYPGLAKNGYIRLLEVNNKTEQAEMRLEKINY